jgi:predicted MFS family arabinose efflux permease
VTSTLLAPTTVPTHRRAERLLIPAAFITALGNNVQLIAGALLMIRADHTMMAVGWLFVAVAAPQALLSPWFGRLADRADRRLLWLGCDGASALLALALPVWLTLGGAQGAGVYLSNLALAAVSALFFPASSALIKERVRPERLRRFNANYEMATQSGMLLSATVGGLAVQAFGATALLVFNAATFAVSALCVAAIGPRATAATHDAREPSHASDAPATTDTAPGTAIPLGRLILLYAQGNVVVTVFNALLPVLVLSELHAGTGAYGAVDALGSLGFLFSAGAYRALSRRAGDLRIAVPGFLLCNVLLVLQAQFGLAGLAIGVPLGAFCFGQARIASRNLLMTSVDAAHAGRAFGLANSGGLAATAAAMPLVATVTDHTDARYGFAALAVLSALAGLTAALLLRRPRP